MSASKCLTEINKVQSFLERINGKMADAGFFVPFFPGGSMGEVAFSE